MVVCPTLTTWKRGRGRGRGGQDDRQNEALPFWLLVDRWRGGGDGIHPEPGRVPALPSPLLVMRPDERLAMVRTVRTAYGTEGRRGGKDDRQHEALPWFSFFLDGLSLCSSLPCLLSFFLYI